MKLELSIQELRKLCFNANIFPSGILDWIATENLWNLWVPKTYGGLELPFTEGLEKLKALAKIDGSLGWTVTLCSGANYFIGNLKNEVAQEIFLKPETPVCFGGSGGVFGIAEQEGDSFKISGKWRYATGAPYLTHFTLNARLIKNGEELKNPDGSPKVRSFLVPKADVHIIEDWNTMGLKASVTHSFEVKEKVLNKKHSFLYNHYYLPHPIFKIHFSVFADLTLWVNYVGIAEHFLDEASAIISKEKLNNLAQIIFISAQQIHRISEEIENTIKGELDLSEAYIHNIHEKAAASVNKLSNVIIQVYPLLGIRASRKNHPLNQIFRDFFTATQHHIFRQI